MPNQGENKAYRDTDISMKNVVCIITGSVGADAAYRHLPKILKDMGANVCVILTESAKKLIVERIPGNFPGIRLPASHALQHLDWDDETNFEMYSQHKFVGHIEAAKWADVVVVCPATANTIGKMAHGIADNMATEVVIAAHGMGKRIFIAPTMNTYMYRNKMVQENIFTLQQNGFSMILPTVKRLACGDYGEGAMPDLYSVALLIHDYKWRMPFEWFMPFEVFNQGHPGGFGSVRKHDIHCGVDLYCPEGTQVLAAEPGIVVQTGLFTGERVGSPWWNETWYAMVEGKSGVILYGEIGIPSVKNGDYVGRGAVVGAVVKVLKDGKARPNEIPGHRESMLHVELYDHGYRFDPVEWKHGDERPKFLKDPSQFLLLAESN